MRHENRRASISRISSTNYGNSCDEREDRGCGDYAFCLDEIVHVIIGGNGGRITSSPMITCTER